MSEKHPKMVSQPSASEERTSPPVLDDPALSGQLLSYALGTLSADEVEEIEGRLMASKDTLAMYLAIKRSLAPPQRGDERPSAQAKERLRKAVAKRYAPSLWQRSLAWLKRPIPRYQSLAFAGLAVLLGVVVWLWWSHGDTPATQSPMIDAASPGIEQLKWS